MPSRVVQTICTTLFLIILYYVDKTTVDSLWILIPAGILVAASFTLGALVNTYWYSKHPPHLNDYEKNWVKRFVPFYDSMPAAKKEAFCNQLALEIREREFISMSEKDIPEELKIMALAPAVALRLVYTDKKAAHYSRIIFYHHAFASPDQQYLHLSETQHEDGALIFATDALEAAYLKPGQFFNTALYEWSCIFVMLYHIDEKISIDSALAWEVINKLISTDTQTLLNYLRQPFANHYALLCYCYVMYPEKLQSSLPAFFIQIKNLIE